MKEQFLSVQRIEDRNNDHSYVTWKIKASNVTFRIVQVSDLVILTSSSCKDVSIYSVNADVLTPILRSDEFNSTESILQDWNSEFGVSWNIDELMYFVSKL